MSDLVTRLRQVGAHHWYEHDGSVFCFRCRTFAADWNNRPSMPCHPDALMTEAAEEIERLREVAVLREQEVAAVRARAVEYHCSLVAARAEIERLRARIAGDPSLATYVTVEDRYLQAKREAATNNVARVQDEKERDEARAEIERLRRELAWKAEVVELPDKHPLRIRAEKAERERDSARAALDGWVKWASSSRCIYCGYEFQHDPHDQAGADEMKKAHILVCDKHPVAEAVALLRDIEWNGGLYDQGRIARCCPCCGREPVDGHNAVCRLDAFLAGGRP